MIEMQNSFKCGTAVSAVALGLLVMVAVPTTTRAADPQTIDKGKTLATTGGGGVPPCSACHGADGGGQAASGIPRLAGLDAGYVHAQLTAFANGSRANAMMGPVAKAMDANAMADAAAYYASLQAPAPEPSTAPETQVAAGKMLAERGDWSRDVPACASCHGGSGHGVGAVFPAIAGQSTAYITNQLKAWKAGSRHDDPLGLMHSVATRLSDEQVAAVAAYYATLPGAAPTGQESAR